MRFVTLRNGEKVPALGLGTWRMGERRGARADEVRALALGLDLGASLIDTAEMYGEGGAEEVVAEATAGRRDQVFIVSKVYPHNASRSGAVAACERSLKRLKTDRLDLYLLHWRGAHPLSHTIEAFEALITQGKIKHWGVSNLDMADMTELASLAHGENCAANQVLYHLGERGIEFELLPRCRKEHIAVMAYSPLGQGKLAANKVLGATAAKYGVTPAAIALAWTIRLPGIITIPKTSSLERMRDNLAAADLELAADDLALLDRHFPPPRRKTPLAMN